MYDKKKRNWQRKSGKVESYFIKPTGEVIVKDPVARAKIETKPSYLGDMATYTPRPEVENKKPSLTHQERKQRKLEVLKSLELL